MKYQITEQYIRSEEKCISSMDSLEYATLFVHKKMQQSLLDKKKIIYRVYDEEGLQLECNPEGWSVSPIQDEENQLQNLSFPFELYYKQKNTLIAVFEHQEDAYLLVEQLLEEEYPSESLFLLYKNKSPYASLNKNTIEQYFKPQRKHDAKGALFRPTPLNTRPTPGVVPDCWKEEDSDN